MQKRKKNIVVVDSKLVMYFQHHRHQHPFNAFRDVARVMNELLPPVDKIIWVKDVSKSKRCIDFPAYKAHRADNRKKMKASEQQRVRDFQKLYDNSDEVVRYFGDVIAINGYEADDLAYIIADKFAGSDDYTIYLFSSDEDWARFLTADNIKMVHYGRERIITRNTVLEEFGVPQDKMLLIDSVKGVDKENVSGIKKAGKGRLMTALKLAEYDDDKFLEILQEWVDARKYGMTLPDWADTVQDVYDRNSKIFAPWGLDTMDDLERQLFNDGWASKTPIDSSTLLLNTTSDYMYPVQVTDVMSKIYKIS